MSKRAHAILSASAAHRWLNCPPSARLTAEMPDTSSAYAEEGTLAHAIAELYLRKRYTEPMGPKKYATALKKLQATEHYKPDMDKALEEYYDLVERTVLSYPQTPHVALELRLDLTAWVPDGFGTGDCVVIGGDTLHVIDYKHGQGVPVSARENPQIMLYGLGALRHYDMLYNIQNINMTICQPRIGNIDTYEATANALRAWGESIKPIAQIAYEGKGDYAAGDWCKFCKARAVCGTRSAKHTALEDFKTAMPPMLTNEEVGDILTRGRNLASWLKDLEEYALGACLNGDEIPGYKAVEGRSIRQFDNAETAFADAIKAGIEETMLYERKPLTLAAVEKLMGKKEFTAVLGTHIIVPPGKPTLAPATDARPALTTRPTAQEDFATGT